MALISPGLLTPTETSNTLGLWQSKAGKGGTNQSLTQTTLNGQVSFDDSLRITAQIPQGDLKTQLQTLSGTSGLQYLDQLAATRPAIQWEQVAVAHDQWAYQTQGLTGAGAALLAVVVAYVTAGAGSSLLGTTTSVAGGGATTSIGTTVLANTTAATATTAAATTYTVTGAVINAGFTSLVTTASTSFINNGGDIGKTLNDLGSNASLRGLVTSMVTAGVLNEVGNTFTIDGKAMNQITVKGDTLTANFTKNLTTAAVSATVDSVINDKPLNLAGVVGSAVITTGSGAAANQIGNLATPTTGAPAQISAGTQILAHAGLGCVVGAAMAGNGSGCAPGAVGAVAGEATAQVATQNGATAPNALGIATIVAAASGVLVAGDNAQAVNIAAATGANAALNNYLNHSENEVRLRAARACADGDQAACTTRDAWNAVDRDRDARLRDACFGNGASTECSVRYADMRVAQESYLGKTVSAATNNSDLTAGLYPYTAAAERDGFRSLVNVPHYDTQAVSRAADAMRFIGNLTLDMTPVVGDAKAFVEANTRFEYALAVVGTLGPAGDLLKLGIREARVLLEAGDTAGAAARMAEANRGLINETNRLIRSYADDIERQTGYRLNDAQRTALAEQLRTGANAVTLNPVQNSALRTEFNSSRVRLIAEWEMQTGQRWPVVVVDGVAIPAQAHHVIPVANAGPAVWWNITPAFRADHQVLHKPGGPLKQLQVGGK